MFATHRDQENLAHNNHHTSTKQQPKTPGNRYPKTPGNFGRNDENAATTFAGKSALASAARYKENGDAMMGKTMGQRPAMVTPVENRPRAPLGNKTTNAKAKVTQSTGPQDTIKHVDKAHARHTGVQKPRQKFVEPTALKLNAPVDVVDGADNDQVPEPEYAPPRPDPLPYESDILPPGGLTFNGLKPESMLKGFYRNFHDPVDENGFSRTDRKFQDEMNALMRKAEEHNARQLAEIKWDAGDVVNDSPNETEVDATSRQPVHASLKPAAAAGHKRPPTLSVRRAASALAVHTDRRANPASKPASVMPKPRRPLSSIISGTRPAKTVLTRPSSRGNLNGEAASRTTLGYNKGRSASSMVHARGTVQTLRQQRPSKATTTQEKPSDLTVTPARLREVALSAAPSQRNQKPQFMAIFDEAQDEDLPSSSVALPAPDSEDEEFELKLTI